MFYGVWVLSIHILIIVSCLPTTHGAERSRTFLMQFTGSQEEAIQLGEQLGLKFLNPVFDEKDDWYVFEREDLSIDRSGEIEEYEIDFKEAKKRDRRLKSLKQETYNKIYPRTITVSDAQWSNQWQLQTSQTPSMNVKNAWDKGYNGNNIVISILDDGIDTDHSDLAANYNSTYSYDMLNGVANPSHKTNGDGHGTNCAGVAGAVKNTNCVIGTAYDATLAAVRILGHRGTTASEEARALTYKLEHVDIYSNSWGPSDDGESFSDITSVQNDAFKKGVTTGRDGKGAIYVWASGNGGDNYDDCNADGYSKSIYTIAIGALSESTAPTWYSEHCSAILAVTYSGDDPNAMITTTGPADTCVNNFDGTSSSCPLAAGIIALTLQANPSLTWRDIQHLIVETSINTGLDGSHSFSTNAAGKKYNHYFGFGLMDAEAMVDAARTWSSVPEYTTCIYPTISVDRYSYHTTITETFVAGKCYITYLEFVEVKIKYAGYYRGDVKFRLDSPSSSQSIIFSRRRYDYSGLNNDITWTFMSVHFWGEDPAGTWTLKMIDTSTSSDTDMELYSWKLTFYGTVTDPSSGTPSAGSLGGACTNSDNCSSITDGGCLLDGKICVTCNNNYRIIKTYCVQDGYRHGFCDETVSCVFSEDECVSNICREKEEENEESNNTGLIVGIVIGGICIIATITYIIVKKVYLSKGRVAPTQDRQRPRPFVGDQPAPTHFEPSVYQSTQAPTQSYENPPPYEAGNGYSNPAAYNT